MSCLPSHCVLFLLAHHLLHVILERMNEYRFTLQALDEARSIARRPMAQSLKDEREEIVVRCYLAKGDADRAVAETAGHAKPGKFHVRIRVEVEGLHVRPRRNGLLHHKCVLSMEGAMDHGHKKSVKCTMLFFASRALLVSDFRAVSHVVWRSS